MMTPSQPPRGLRSCMLCGLVAVASFFPVRADVVSYTLENVVLEDHTRITGTFTWTFAPGDFENGVGQFTSLEIPWTGHDHTDLDATFDIGKSIEITLSGNFHDDGVDITLFLSLPLTPATSSAVDLERSAYDIGGNGFHAGEFISGQVVPVPPVLQVTAAASATAVLTWEPDVAGYVLEQADSLSPPTWTASPHAAIQPVVVPTTHAMRVYRLAGP